MSSQLACRDLCGKLDPYYSLSQGQSQTNIRSAIVDYNNKVKHEAKLEDNIATPPRQQILSQAIDDQTLELLRESSRIDLRFQAHLNHTTESGAGSWLHIVPAKALRTDVDPLLFRTMIQRWIRVPIFESEFHCPYCDDIIDKHSDHCLTCASGGDYMMRHNLLCNEVYLFFVVVLDSIQNLRHQVS